MSDHIVKHEQLKDIVEYSWGKTKERYDVAFKNATISPNTGDEKHITFDRINGQTPLKVSLDDYARLQDRNAFKKDVSVNDAANVNNTHIGTVNGAMSRTRFLAYRGLTSKSFIDGYVHSIIVYIDSSVPNNTASTWKVWAINKKQNKNSDTINNLLYNAYAGTVETLNINGTDRKIVRIPVDRTFDEEVYFLLRTATQDIQAMTQISSQYIEDVINVPHDQSSSPNANVNYNDNATNNTIAMHLVGRESIKSLSEKLNKVNSDSSTYVKHTDCIDGTEQIEQREKAGKVVKLGTDGKLHSSLMPKIAINEYYPVTTFDHDTLNRMEYENGDVVVVVTSDGQVTKRYLCIKKDKNQNNLTEGFVELNSKDGTITSINGNTPGPDGNIVVTTKKTGERVSLSFGTSGNDVDLFSYMTEQEVRAIKDLFV